MEKEFTSLIKENERVILKVCNVYCKQEEDREDLYQDIIIQLWKSFPKFQRNSLISTWIYRIALNTAISRYRKVSKMPAKELLQSELAVTDTDESKNEEVKQLQEAIASLTAIEKAIITLYLDEFKYKEIGEIMSLSESNIGFKINMIKKKLKKILDENEN